MGIIAGVQAILFGVLGLACFVVEIWAFIDAIRRPSSAFVAAEKQTKVIWCAITGGAALVGFLGMPPLSPLGGFGGLLSIAAIVAAVVYLVSVRPAIKPYGGGPRGPKGGSGSRW